MSDSARSKLVGYLKKNGRWPCTGCVKIVSLSRNCKSQLKTFPKGTACGRDRLRAQHMKGMISGCCDSDKFLEAVTYLVNKKLSGALPPSLAPFISSAPLMGLVKPKGDIRPIAVGEIWRRLTSKCANSFIKSKAVGYLSPLQVGVGVLGGAEAVVHAAGRCYTKSQQWRAFNVEDRFLKCIQFDIEVGGF
eukprot:Partr_v1_DN28573_c2_g1_i2_m73653 putative NA